MVKGIQILKIVKILLLLIPNLIFSQNNCVTIIHKGYTCIYDTTIDYPIMVKWIETRNRIDCSDKFPRKNKFKPDPLLQNQTDLKDEYELINRKHKERGIPGIDRGHMCPAADNQCDQTLLDECFYFSNIVPQYHSLNAGDWKKLEVMTRELSLVNDSVFIWCGSVGISEKFNGLAIPTKCWKVIYVLETKTFYSYIFVNNSSKPKGINYWKVSLNEVEKLIGMKIILQ